MFFSTVARENSRDARVTVQSLVKAFCNGSDYGFVCKTLVRNVGLVKRMYASRETYVAEINGEEVWKGLAG